MIATKYKNDKDNTAYFVYTILYCYGIWRLMIQVHFTSSFITDVFFYIYPSGVGHATPEIRLLEMLSSRRNSGDNIVLC